MTETPHRVYVDANATTPMTADVAEAMEPWTSGVRFGNPSSLHWAGRDARKAVERARERVARLIGASPSEVVFTSGGTEANALAIGGVMNLRSGGSVVVSAVEHPSVLDACASLEKRGARVVRVGVDADGAIDPKRFLKAVPDDAALVSIMRVNNETGNLFPVREVAWELRERGIVVHCDAVQAVGCIPVNVRELGADLMSMSAHKFHGPIGAGALFVRRGVAIAPLLRGGPQEDGRRAGTENVAAIAGMGRAARVAMDGLKPRAMRVAALRDRFERELFARVGGVRLNGHRLARAPGTLNVSFEGADGDAVLIALDLEGVAASSGAACASGAAKPSHVLLAMGRTPVEAASAVRFSFHSLNSDEDVDRLLEVVPAVVERMRREEGGRS